jgi:peptidoglycan/xylan/chitin deacetylase (PgdA/CDA1 family)
MKRRFALCFFLPLALSCATRVPIVERPPDTETEVVTMDTIETREDEAAADEPRLEEAAPLTESGVLLSFDDEYYAEWEAAFPMFATYGARVTFFVQGNAEFCLRALAAGHDIGYHTKTHPDLRALDRESWQEEAVTSAEGLRQKGVALSAFAYPFGFSDGWMKAELLNHYPILRDFGAETRVYRLDGEEIAGGLIVSKSIDNTVIKTDEDFFHIIDAVLQTAATTGGLIVPFTTHNIDDRAQWGIRADRLEYVLKKTVEAGLRFYTYAELKKLSADYAD